MTEAPDSQIPVPQAAVARPRRMWFADLVLLLTAGAAFGLDQLSKYAVSNSLDLGEAWPAHSFFRLKHATNSGSAFGLFPNQTMLLIVASVFAIGFLVYFYRTHAMPRRLLRFAIGLQLGGAFGNLFDRVRDGAVVDFIDVGPWPIFNLADSSIVVGMAILIGVLVLADEGTEKEPEHPPGSGERDEPSGPDALVHG
ncbi:MAG: signal peptidase II [Chloroflexi bacterium]|nr:signal peptidase II [Chloroflexota bacterium]